MYLNDAGRAAESFWKAIPEHFPHAKLDEYKVMPNHIHGIIWIVDDRWVPVGTSARAIDIPIAHGELVTGSDVLNVGAKGGYVGANNHSPLQDPSAMTQIHETPGRRPRGTSKTIGSMVRGFKIAVTRWLRPNGYRDRVWQRNYHDHIIRNERSLERIRKYIRDNPANWHRDRNNPKRRI